MKILVIGDFCPLKKHQSAINDPAFAEFFAPHVQGVDHVVANLECPLTAQLSPILKGGPHLSAPPEMAAGMASMGIHSVTLANNHIMDHGAEGLQSTLRALNDHGIQHFGADSSLTAASQPLRVGHQLDQCLLWGFAEREYSYADGKSPGAAPADLSLMVRRLEPLKGKVPSVVLLHGGNEHYPFPNPALQDKCRLLVELGALAVICQHSHCIGTYEVWQGGLIVYGQGNFLFDHPPSTRREWFEGLMVELEIRDNVLQSFRFHPVSQTPEYPFLNMDSPSDNARILEAFEHRSAQIKDPEEVQALWHQFTTGKTRAYQSLLFGHSRWQYLLNKFFGVSDWRSRSAKMNIGNILRCEAHLEALKSIYSLENTAKHR